MWFDSNGHLEWDSAHGATGAIHTGAAIGNHMWHHIAVSRESGTERTFINDIKADNFDENTVYVSLDNHNWPTHRWGSKHTHRWHG